MFAVVSLCFSLPFALSIASPSPLPDIVILYPSSLLQNTMNELKKHKIVCFPLQGLSLKLSLSHKRSSFLRGLSASDERIDVLCELTSLVERNSLV